MGGGGKQNFLQVQKLVDGCCGRRCRVQNSKTQQKVEKTFFVYCFFFFLDLSRYCDIRIVASAAAVAVYCFAEASRCLPQIIAASFFPLRSPNWFSPFRWLVFKMDP